MSVLAVGGEYFPAFADNVTSNFALYVMKTLAQNVRGMRIPNSSHWTPGGPPDVIIKLLDGFFGGNTTNTSTSDPILRHQQVPRGNSRVHMINNTCDWRCYNGLMNAITFNPSNKY